MHNLYIPETPEAYMQDMLSRAFPDPNLRNHNFYQRLIGWVADHRTPLLYEQDHDDEYTNFSINFNWLLLRDYGATRLGPPDTIATMYALHEFTHMTHWLPVSLDGVSAQEYAEAFTASEYRASNETEILIHYRVPELRQTVFNGMRIAFDIMRERHIPQLPAGTLAKLRAVVIESDVLEPLFSASPEDQEVYARFKLFSGNRKWAAERYKAIKPYFAGLDIPDSVSLGDYEYERVINAYEPRLSQEVYQANVVRNIKFGYAMCGLAVPAINNFAQALEAAGRLEGHHAIVQS